MGVCGGVWGGWGDGGGARLRNVSRLNQVRVGRVGQLRGVNVQIDWSSGGGEDWSWDADV